jgi:hypothetical protein
LFTAATAQTTINHNDVYQIVKALITTQIISTFVATDALITARSSSSTSTGGTIKVITPTAIAVFCRGKVLSAKLVLRKKEFSTLRCA